MAKIVCEQLFGCLDRPSLSTYLSDKHVRDLAQIITLFRFSSGFLRELQAIEPMYRLSNLKQRQKKERRSYP